MWESLNYFASEMLCGTHDYPIQNIKCYYCSVNNTNCWTISASKKTKKTIEKQTNHIEGSVFVFYKRNSVNCTQEKNKKKI